MARLLDKIQSSNINRRQFVGMATAVGLTSSLGLTGCDNKMQEVSDQGSAVDKLENGEWKPFICLSVGCGYKCHNKAYVVDGVIVRQGSDNSVEDTPNTPQNRCCCKGWSTRRIITAAERLKYPMKRKSWQPGGKDFHPELRGVDEWERISWDEAIDYIVSELSRITDTYGPESLLNTGVMELRTFNFGAAATCSMFGGARAFTGVTSQGGLPVVWEAMRGYWGKGWKEAQDYVAMRNSKLIVMWGLNPAWTGGGGSNVWNFLNAKKAQGCKIIFVDPYYNPTMQAIGDQWIPCRPGTDGALLEALAYEMITNDLQDQEFLDKYTVGFDADHMPADAATDENFKDHILGVYDGIPKTPEWASKICGASAETIREFAREIATTKPMAWKASGAPARTSYGNRFAQLFLTVGLMTGNVGKLGGEIAAAGGAQGHFGSKGSYYVLYGHSGYGQPRTTLYTPWPANKEEAEAFVFDPNTPYPVAHAETFQSVVNGEYHVPGKNGGIAKCDIRCIYRDAAWNQADQGSDGYWAERAYRKDTVEFVVVHDLFLTRDAQYADIVIPIASTLEAEIAAGDRESVTDFSVVGTQVVAPYFETKYDIEVYQMIADKLGLSEEEYPRITVKQAEFNKMVGATVVADDGETREPFLTITQEDIDNLGVVGEPQEGRVNFQEFLKTGIYHVPRSDDDNLMNICDKPFIDDPEANPLATTSGKYEIYCQKLKDTYDWCLFNDIDAIPKYKASQEGYEQISENPEYKYQMVSIHYIGQAHTVYSNVKQLKEVYPNNLLMSTYDAQKDGFTNGEWVLIEGTTGAKAVRRVAVIPNLMPGVVLLGQGNWREINQETGIDEGANANTLVNPQLLGDGYQNYNNVLVKIDHYTGAELLPDYKREPIVANV